MCPLRAQAQIARSAKESFDRGRQRLERKDIDGVIDDYTHAIELLSRPVRGHKRGRRGVAPKSTPEPSSYGFERVGFLDLNLAAVYANRCLARDEKKDFDGAIADCNQALSISPRIVEALLNRGNVHYARRDFDQAVSDFNRALNIDPGYAEAHYNCGNVRRDQGDYREAIADFDRAIACNPRFFAAFYNRGFARWRIGDGE